MNLEDATWQRLREAASAPYRQAGRYAWHFARGKLGRDPVFRHVVSAGLVPAGSRVLDIGCGQGLMTSLLHHAGAQPPDGWPATWGKAPRDVHVVGVELMMRDVERARAALGDVGTFTCGDMRHVPFPAVDAVVMLDVLHYITHAEQDAVMTRVSQALVPGGCLLMRVGDMRSRRGFVFSRWVDHLVMRLRGLPATSTFGRTLADWMALLTRLGFTVQPQPMSDGTPFANVLLVGRRTA